MMTFSLTVGSLCFASMGGTPGLVLSDSLRLAGTGPSMYFPGIGAFIESSSSKGVSASFVSVGSSSSSSSSKMIGLSGGLSSVLSSSSGEFVTSST